MQRTTLALKWGQKVATGAGRSGLLCGAYLAPRSDRITHVLVRPGLFGKAELMSLEGATQQADGTLVLEERAAGSGRPRGAVPFTAKTEVHRTDGSSARVRGLLLDHRSHSVTGLLVGDGRDTRVVSISHFRNIASGSPSTSLDAAQLGEFPEYLSDHEVRRNAVAALVEAGLGDGLSVIDVQVTGGTALLAGNVRYSVDLVEAEDAVRRARGVLSVENALHSDQDLEIAAASTLAQGGITRRGLVLAKGFLGRISLSGYLDSAEYIEQAVSLVGEVQGVRSVEHNIEIRPLPIGGPGVETQATPATEAVEAEAEVDEDHEPSAV